MAGKRKAHPQAKWDWELAQALYLAGMDGSAILALPEFDGLSRGMLHQRIYKMGWSEKRKALRLNAQASAALTAHDRAKNLSESYWKFMLDEISQEMAIYRSRAKTTSTKDQSERIDLLTRIDQVARKALGLDEQSAVDPMQQGFKWLSSFHGASRNDSDSVSATMTFQINKNATAGDSVRSRAILEKNITPFDTTKDENGADGDHEGQLSSPIALSAPDEGREGLPVVTKDAILENYRANPQSKTNALRNKAQKKPPVKVAVIRAKKGGRTV